MRKMKKLIFLSIILLVSSCSSSNRVCGGKGGRRCVDVLKFNDIVDNCRLS